MDSEGNKPTLMEIKDSPQENIIFWNVITISSDQIHNLMNTTSLIERRKMDMLEDQLYQTYIISIDAKNKYEEELKRTNYVMEKRLATLDEEVRSLRNVARPFIELKEQES